METKIQDYQRAIELAHQAHAKQKYGVFPYTRHLAHVVSVLFRFGLGDDWDMVTAGWLHDIVEDTEMTLEDLRMLFNQRVVKLVDCVTDGEGKNRKEKKAWSYAKMVEYTPSIVLKLGDRIANVESAIHAENDDMLKMYFKEYQSFSENLNLEEYDEFSRIGEMNAYLYDLLIQFKGTKLMEVTYAKI